MTNFSFKVHFKYCHFIFSLFQLFYLTLILKIHHVLNFCRIILKLPNIMLFLSIFVNYKIHSEIQSFHLVSVKTLTSYLGLQNQNYIHYQYLFCFDDFIIKFCLFHRKGYIYLSCY